MPGEVEKRPAGLFAAGTAISPRTAGGPRVTGTEAARRPGDAAAQSDSGPLVAGAPLVSWVAFGGCLLAVFMQMIDVTIVNTALPAITADLRATPAQQLLVVTAYSVAFAVTLLPAARLGERAGRRAMFLASVLGFTAASVWCGMSATATELVVARVAQGAAGAGMAAQTIAILGLLFPRALHAAVFAVYGATAGLAGMLGPILGGALVSANIAGSHWHAVFLINLPLGLFAAAVAWRYLHVEKSTRRPGFDPVGTALSVTGLLLALSALAWIQEAGWRIGAVALGGAGLAIGAVFVGHQLRSARRGGAPLVRPELFGDRGFAVGSVLVTLFFGLFAAFVFAASIILQDIVGFSPLRTGLTMTPFALGAGAGALASLFLVRRFGVRVPALALCWFGFCLFVAAGYLWWTGGTVDLRVAVAPIFVCGLGVGVFGVQIQPLMLAGLDQDRMGEASGLLPTIEQIGNGLGLALLSALFFRSHTLGGAIVMFCAIGVTALVTGVVALALPAPATEE